MMPIFAAAVLLGLADAPAVDMFRTDTIRSVLTSAVAPLRRVDIDNLLGSVDVIGTSASDVRVTAVRRMRVRGEEAFAEADSEVTLETRTVGTTVVIYVDAPWRVRYGMMGDRMWRYGFEVRYDLRVEVPEGVELAARTVDEGDVRVHGVSGTTQLSCINGDIMADGLRSTASLASVNGNVTATFDAVPTDDCDFRTVNGTVEVAFPETIVGTFAVGNMRGDIYTDFDVQPTPRRPIVLEEGRVWKRYSAASLTRVTVGTGGPEYRFETTNGTIYILKRTE